VRVALVVSLLATRAVASTVVTVDLASTIRPVTHAASGSLYGITEKLPADVNALVTPLHPNVFINPAADVQQPVGDAIAVAGRVAPTGARVTIRLADWFPRWPYAFTNMSDWLDKVGQTVSRKKASGLDNYYGYEIWNEPNGTWTSSMSFNDFWKQTHAKLRELDPNAKIIGPSVAWYDGNYLKNFLSFAKANDCLPDIVSWHELSGGNLAGNFQNYRSLEKQLGIGALPISINEYSGKDTIDDEGQPGASAPIIAKFERFQVDSACISYWDVPHPGRLGSLMASDTSKNGGWWFYKWYGDMSGNMVVTTPPSPNDAAALDAFASLDASLPSASVLFAGGNDGAIQIVVKGFAAAPLLGSSVHAVVEHTPFVNRSTVVNGTDTVSTADLTVLNGQITVTVNQTNASDGYRLSLSPAGGASTGGVSVGGGETGSGGRTSTGGAAGRGGTMNDAGGKDNGGAIGNGGAANQGGAGGQGTTAGMGGVPGVASGGGAMATSGSGAGGSPVVERGAGSGSAHDSGCACGLSGARVTDGVWQAALVAAAFGMSRAGRRKRGAIGSA